MEALQALLSWERGGSIGGLIFLLFCLVFVFVFRFFGGMVNFYEKRIRKQTIGSVMVLYFDLQIKVAPRHEKKKKKKR